MKLKYLIKKNSLILFASFFLIISIVLKFNNKQIIIEASRYSTNYQYTHYYPGDPTGSGSVTGSGHSTSEFTTDDQGWYYYNYHGKDYLVVAAALVTCRDSSGHCGINVNKHGIAKTINYYKYYDTLTLPINGKMYDAIVLDACGACMWERQDTRGTELFDIFTTASSSFSASGGTTDANEKNPMINRVHYTTSYTGTLEEGWLYHRLKLKALKDDHRFTEQEIDNDIDEIFERAKENYKAYLKEYGINAIMEDYYEDGIGTLVATADGFITRMKPPSKNGEGWEFYFSDANASYAGGYEGQCTWYAYGRANEILANAGSSLRWNIAANAGLWYSKNAAKGQGGFQSSSDYTKPRVGAIISWSQAGGAGHVAVVEEVNGDQVTISEGNYTPNKDKGIPYGFRRTTVSVDKIGNGTVVNSNGTYKFNGYIYLLQ